jgi:PKD repeat protein
MNLASIATLAGIVYETDLPVPAFKASETTIMEGSTVQFTDFSLNDPTEWHWYFDGGDPEEFDGKEPPEILYDTPGSYDVKLVVTNQFGSNELILEDYITVTPKTAIAEQDMLSKISVHPNPTDGQLIIATSDVRYPISDIEIFDIMGRLCHAETGRAPSLQSEIGQSEIAFNISYLPSGIYFHRNQTENNVITKKIIKN